MKRGKTAPNQKRDAFPEFRRREEEKTPIKAPPLVTNRYPAPPARRPQCLLGDESSVWRHIMNSRLLSVGLPLRPAKRQQKASAALVRGPPGAAHARIGTLGSLVNATGSTTAGRPELGTSLESSRDPVHNSDPFRSLPGEQVPGGIPPSTGSSTPTVNSH